MRASELFGRETQQFVQELENSLNLFNTFEQAMNAPVARRSFLAMFFVQLMELMRSIGKGSYSDYGKSLLLEEERWVAMNMFEHRICFDHDDPNFCVRMIRVVRKRLLDPSTCRDFVVFVECLPRCRAGEECFEIFNEVECEPVYDDMCLKVCVDKWYPTTCMSEVPWFLFLDELLATEKLVLEGRWVPKQRRSAT